MKLEEYGIWYECFRHQSEPDEIPPENLGRLMTNDIEKATLGRHDLDYVRIYKNGELVTSVSPQIVKRAVRALNQDIKLKRHSVDK